MRGFLPLLGTASLMALAAGAGYMVSAVSETDSSRPTAIDATQSSVDATPSNVSTQLLPRARPNIFYAAITDRPLFAQTRRPQVREPVVVIEEEEPEPVIVEAPAPVEDPVIPKPNAVLLGVVTGGARNAALISIDGSDPEWMRVGADVAGWKIEAIDADTIRLSETDRTLKIDLYRK